MYSSMCEKLHFRYSNKLNYQLELMNRIIYIKDYILEIVEMMGVIKGSLEFFLWGNLKDRLYQNVAFSRYRDGNV